MNRDFSRFDAPFFNITTQEAIAMGIYLLCLQIPKKKKKKKSWVKLTSDNRPAAKTAIGVHI